VKIDVFTLIYNEVDFLPYFLRYYEQFATRIFVWDDKSTDGTRELLKAHPKVTILELEKSGAFDVEYAKYLWTQYKNYSRGKADWVVLADVDEILYHPQVKTQLQAYLKWGVDMVHPVGYTMMHETFPTTKGQIFDEVKWGIRDRNMDKKAIFRPELDVEFVPGRHRLAHLSITPKRDIKIRYRTGFRLLHYRYFGLDYFLARLKRNCERMGMTNTPHGDAVFPYNAERRWRLPDGTRGFPSVWYPANMDKREKVV
jgi:hypothetical protein